MAVLRGARSLLLVFALAPWSAAQEGLQHSIPAPATAPEKISLSEVSSVDVPSLPAESIGAPLLCDSDGRILFRLATPEAGVEDPVSVSRDGKTVVRFGREKINDIPRPVVLSVFLLGSDVYILTKGSLPLGSETKWRTPTGEVVGQPASKPGTWVAHFDHDGNYAGAVRLEVPFKPLHLGVFENGDFLIAGAEPSTDEPRLALIASNGQFRRAVEPKGDVHAQEKSDISKKDDDPTALPRRSPRGSAAPSLFDAVYTSQIASDGPNLLLVRPMNGPIFSISSSGEVRTRKLGMEGNYRIYTIKANGNSWIVEFLHDVPHSEAVELSTYAVNPDSGALLREYFFPSDIGWGLACTNGNEFTFVVANPKANTLKLVKLASATSPN